jgi:ABC-2 type transport system permease protein
MTSDLGNVVSHFVSLSWLTGPIFDKELRVSSRRRRNYLIRSTYVMLLTFTVVLTWARMTSGSGASLTVRMARSGQVGQAVIMAITWFQFLVGQLLAVILLSNSIGEEIRRGTLDVLMTTPINSLQIVVGKVLGKLLQLILLLAVSLPLLAIVRVFGGMPWAYVVSSVCITLTTMVFAGSLSLLLSVKARRPYSVILITVMLLVFVYFLAIMQTQMSWWSGGLAEALILVNPVAVMWATSVRAISGTGSVIVSWPLHCLTMLGGSVVVLAAAVVGIRRGALAALPRSFQNKRSLSFYGIFKRRFRPRKHGLSAEGSIRAVAGSPVVWKELGRPLSESMRSNTVIFVLLALGLLLAMCLSYGALSGRGGMPVYYLFTTGLWAVASVRTTAMAAVSVAGEKEARTWPILMSTTLEDWQIIRGKALVVLWRTAPAWIILAVSPAVLYCFAHIIGQSQSMFSPSRSYSVLYLVWGLIAPIAVPVFLTGTGLYVSVRLSSATSAVVAAIGCMIAVWFAQRALFLVIIAAMARMPSFSPDRHLLYQGISLVFYLAAGVLLIWRAKRRIRRNIF